MTLDELNMLPAPRAEAEFHRCCGSARWAHMMAAERPFGSAASLAAAADRIWCALEPDDWREAFGAHPRIGGPATSSWSAEEQAGAASATTDVRERLADGNLRYERRFGYTFLVCATGKTAGELLTVLEHRLRNAPGDELRVAAEEQRKITELRLKKLMTP